MFNGVYFLFCIVCLIFDDVYLRLFDVLYLFYNFYMNI